MRKTGFLAATFVLALAWAKPAAADNVIFDYAGAGCPGGAGTGTCVTLQSFDWLQGNSLIMVTSPTTATILYQANLNQAIATPAGAAGDIPNGTGGNFFTAVAEFNVVLGAANTFTVLPGGTFEVYHDNAYADDLTGGAEFSDGTLVVAGTALSGNGTFAFTNQAPQLLDQFEDDDHSGVLTLIGGGGGDITVDVTLVNANFFPFMNPAVTLSFTNTSLIDPFRQIDPTDLFFEGTPGVPSVGAVNGQGPNIITQADANSSFEVGVIPEPATLTLLGMGLLGTAAARRRQMRKSK
jgi:hypothetical protein